MIPTRRSARSAAALWWLIGAGLLFPASGAEGQVAPQRSGVSLVAGDTVLATPDSRFHAGAFHRWVLGDGWRELWAVPVPAPVLDLGTFAGGLEPTRVGGGLQTQSLRFRGADGRTYNFRSLDKDASRALDPLLRETLAADVAEDRIGALFPLSAMVVAEILDAAGVLHPNPQLVVMPDDGRLGEFREAYAGLLGWIEERPDELEDGSPGFEGSSRVVGSERLFERLEEGPESRVDSEAFLRARLIDFLVADWDRHPDQWRWAGFDEEGVVIFQPVPRDRDWALSRLDGLVATFTGIPWPHYVGIDVEYPSTFRLSWSGRALDRRILTDLEWGAWERVIDDLMARVTDEVVRGAVRALPDSYYDRVGEWLTGALLNRRSDLPRVAREFYTLLADEVDVRGTDEEEVATFERLADGGLRLTLALIDDEIERPYYDRTFLPAETSEIRVDLRGDDDRIEIVGESEGPIRVRVDGGGSDDTFVDRTSGQGVTFYSDRGDDTFETGPRTKIDRSEWDEPVDPEENTHRAGYRSWGVRWLPVPLAELSPDVGLFLGGGVRRTAYGFRHYPYQSRLEARVGVGTATQRLRADVTADFPLPLRSRGIIRVELDDAKENRFYGLGNGTVIGDRSESAFQAPRSRLQASALLRKNTASGVAIEAGVAIESRRELDAEGTLIDELQPYGWGDFSQLSVTGGIHWSGLPEASDRSGLRLGLTGRFSPETFDVDHRFGSLAMTAAARLAGGGRLEPTLALRAGGKKVWGTFPVHDAAYVGGSESLRGFRNERFAGDAALYAGSELRIFLTDIVFLLPGEFGILGLADIGRVYGGDVESSRWHSAGGGGVWVRWVNEYLLSVAIARGDELTGVYVSLGFPF